MKIFNILLAILMLCFSAIKVVAQEKNTDGYAIFGEGFSKKKVSNQNTSVYERMQSQDTIQTQLTGEITEVCQAKGCWMKVHLSNDKEVFVKFKDYAFFVPLDVAGKKVVMNGQAFVEKLSVEDQKHFAKDKGASDEEIEKIVNPKETLRFEASGVLIK